MFTFSKCFGPFFPSEKYIVNGKRDMHKTAAKKGNAKAQALLAQMYYDGIEVDKD